MALENIETLIDQSPRTKLGAFLKTWKSNRNQINFPDSMLSRRNNQTSRCTLITLLPPANNWGIYFYVR
ncbi:hypothetical protein CEP10_07210 [Cylindrospermopsis raciborskii S07]|uniref:Uncharacterized protein n=2 Tax=Cylindrospermopsis raciborskii TaxID=77022 RepID=A0A853M9I6_9CYAN|nr:hypothetical protein CRC_00139 [Cylindrospermopsis raciborskii CS-505]OHY39854.1 hypothetical protein BCV63_11970 [Cylindrospermopsis raciborskii CS-508]PNJ97853.1 hypothetical protein CEP13_01805 [Cylindrospermopsis raciborskii C03]PNJ99448.1 hypothetical protein CEP14_00815 [Cylindrospermopsis raciborskii C04]PNK00398.1 hypothetical protein CEP15_03710 [Cylindrospermopsis raciborskii C07]PNK01288.1 hypothetical protein CEP11_17710 [Cylindrospermopsis raciborskii S10]PNK08342.1 hypothetic